VVLISYCNWCFSVSPDDGSRIEIQIVYQRADIMNRKLFRTVNSKIYKQ